MKTPLVFCVGLGLLGFSACGKIDAFTSPDPVADGVRGKTWRTPQYLELDPDDPQLDPTYLRSFLTYQLAASETQAHLAVTLYDEATALFKGYTRRFDGSWSVPGVGFGLRASDSASLGLATIAAGPGGLWFAAFKADSAAPQKLFTAQSSGAWAQPTSASLSNSGPTLSATTSDFSFGLQQDAAFDGLGRAYVANLHSVNRQVRLFSWSQAGALNTTAMAGQTYTGSTVAALQTRVLWDGIKWVCLISSGQPTGGGSLGSQCYDTTGAIAWGAGTSVYDELGTPVSGTGLGVDSDQEGTLLVAWVESVAGLRQVRVGLVENGVASDAQSIQTISGDMPTGFQASNASYGTVSVAALSKGKFLVSWVGASNSEQAIYYRVFDASLGELTDEAAWTALDTVGEMVSGPRLRTVTVFSNRDGNAGMAASYSAAGDDIYTLWVARYQVDQGWLTVQEVGEGCDASSGAGASVCSHRPQGAILGNGDTVVVFPDQDTSGQFRISGVEFK